MPGRRRTSERRMIHVWLSEASRKRLRVAAAQEDKTMQAFVEDLIEETLDRRRAK